MRLAPRDRDRERHGYPAKLYSAATPGSRYAAEGLPAGVKTPMIVISVVAEVLDDVHLSGPQAEGRARSELLGRVSSTCSRPGPSGTQTISSYRW